MIFKVFRKIESLKPRICRITLSRQMCSGTEDVLFEEGGGVGSILLNRPKVNLVFINLSYRM